MLASLGVGEDEGLDAADARAWLRVLSPARSVTGAGSRNSAPRSGPAHTGTVSVWYHLAVALTLRTDEELERALDMLCEQEGLSRQELIRRAVLERAERAGHVRRVEAAAERAVERWSNVLDRLGTV